jgi:hypothetical protein
MWLQADVACSLKELQLLMLKKKRRGEDEGRWQ